MWTDASRRGFTLIEMLIVIAIVGVLAALLMPALQNALRTANKVSCANNLRSTFVATRQYADDGGDLIPHHWAYFPSVPGGWSGYSDWLHRMIYFNYIPGGYTLNWGAGHSRSHSCVCPSRGEGQFTTSCGGYALNDYGPMWNLGVGVTWPTYRFNTFKRPSMKVLISEGGNFTNAVFSTMTYNGDFKAAYRHSDAMNAIFVDGHAGSFDFMGGYSNNAYFNNLY